MAQVPEWSRAVFEKSLTSTCWWYTPYDEGWCDGVGIAVDDEMRELVGMERAAEPVPDWAKEIVRTWIQFAPPCGHYRFPEPYLDLVSAVGSENASAFRASCYCVDRERKRAAMDYCLCLDAWLAGPGPEPVAAELNTLGYRKIDWHRVCRDLWNVLGERTEFKKLFVERTLLAIRHAIKASRWADDNASEFGRDQYLGDFALSEEGRYPVFSPGRSRQVADLDRRLNEFCPEWWRVYTEVDYGFWWLCAPKAFRFLERNLWAIGREKPLEKGEEVPGFLQCEDTYPNQDEAAEWYRDFCEALDAWWKRSPELGVVANNVNRRLGDRAPVKEWLVRLFLKKLRAYESNGEQFTRLVRPRHDHKRGRGPIHTGE